ncbi:MAG: agmatinase [Melioribacteraceae bacterium]|nr:agmatinase [Melioribacteraceae bacterium]MCF8353052.1 agmatinase [Melioribacteraceae bacterium]MCF8392943.1 agmatinase [Melioribacteraceae bacterium]MCF8417762.1 agmatinase [Melioribacteraceae bacterium]
MKTLGIKNNFLAIEKEFSDYEKSQVVILSAPLEATVSYGGGTKNGPKEIIKASHYVEFYDEEFDRELCFDTGIAALKPIQFNEKSVKKSINKIYKNVVRLLTDNKFVVTLGGEHSLSSAPIRAHHEKYENLSILQIDAHSDLRDSYEGTKYSHASVMARVVEFNKNITQVGIRAQELSESKFIKENGINTFYARDIRLGKYGENWQYEVLQKLSENVYITFDVDGLDPSVLPATGTPEPGGLYWDETIDLIKLVGKERKIVGFDVVELAPSKFHESSNFTAAKLVYKILNCAMQIKQTEEVNQ